LRLIVAAVLGAVVLAAPGGVATPSETGQAEAASPAYADGRRDRKGWEDWFNGLAIGSYQDGAIWWYGERSKASPRGCVSAAGDVEWEAGCRAAQRRLALADIRWKTEALYALGWESEVTVDLPPEPITMPPGEAAVSPGFADGRHDRQAPDDWLRRLPRGAYRDGAIWWLDEHDKKRPEACFSPAEDAQWEAGCRAAQGRLALPDVRRTTEADYRMGWNSEGGTQSP
jgi:hypothetical protein